MRQLATTSLLLAALAGWTSAALVAPAMRRHSAAGSSRSRPRWRLSPVCMSEDTVLAEPEALVEPASSAVFFFIVASILYSCGSNALGKLPNNIPVISQAAERSLGPF